MSDTGSPAPSGLKELFSFEGRYNRLRYFLIAVGVSVIGGLAVLIIGMLFGTPDHAAEMAQGGVSYDVGPVGAVLMILIYIPMIWIGLANSVKRCHDNDWSGWLVLIMLIPVIGFIFALVLLFKKGTAGPNRFGPDPLGQPDPAAF